MSLLDVCGVVILHLAELYASEIAYMFTFYSFDLLWDYFGLVWYTRTL